jgi:hypothetical protein
LLRNWATPKHHHKLAKKAMLEQEVAMYVDVVSLMKRKNVPPSTFQKNANLLGTLSGCPVTPFSIITKLLSC